MSADGLAPNAAKPSVGNMLIIKLYMFDVSFIDSLVNNGFV